MPGKFRQSVLYHSLSVLMNMIVTLGLGMVANILVTRMIGPEQRGLHAVASILAMTLTIVADFGMNSALLYNISLNQNREAAISEGLAVSFNLMLFSILIAAVLYMITYFVGHTTFLKGVGIPLLFVSFIYCLLAMVIGSLSTLFIGIRDFRARNLLAVVSASSYFAAVGIWYFFNLKLTASLALALNIGGIILAIVVSLAYLQRNYHPRLVWRMPPDWRSRYLNFGLKSLVAQFAVQGNARLDTFIINALLDNHSVGIYAASTNIAEMSQHIVNATSTVLYPEIAKREGQERFRLINIMIGGTLYAVIITSIGLALIMPWFMPALFGQAFASGGTGGNMAIARYGRDGTISHDGHRDFGGGQAGISNLRRDGRHCYNCGAGFSAHPAIRYYRRCLGVFHLLLLFGRLHDFFLH